MECPGEKWRMDEGIKLPNFRFEFCQDCILKLISQETRETVTAEGPLFYREAINYSLGEKLVVASATV